MSRPSLNRVLSNEYKTLNTPEHKVLVEGRFLQINSLGKPVNQVWLGLTKTELIISEIDDGDQRNVGPAEGSLTDGKSSNNGGKLPGKQGNHGRGGLKLKKTLPMKFVRILVIDDRAKRIAVVTNTKNITLYEMCRPKYDWGRWKHAAAKLHQKHNKHTRSETLLTADNTDAGVSKYVTYPFLCRQVTDTAAQTEPLLDPPPLSAESTTTCTCFDDLHPIVVQEYQVAMGRVSFCEDEEIFALCKTGHHVGLLRSRSTTLVDDRKQSRIPHKSSSCPWLWKPPASVSFGNDSELFHCHYARRDLSEDELSTIEKMLQYRKKLRKAPKASGEWDAEYTWIWDDGISEAEEDLYKILEEAEENIELNQLQPENATPCPECGEVIQSVGPRQRLQRIPKDVVNISADDVREFHAGEIAMQLSVRDKNLLWLLTQSDLTRLALSSPPGSIRITESVALQKMAAWAKRVARLVATEVLDQPNYENCMESLKLFIKVAEFCWVLRNFNSFINVMRGLQFYAVYRLGVVWEFLQKSDPNMCQLYLILCDKMIKLIFKLYKFGPRAKHVPSDEARIPWFPAFLCRLVNEVRHHQGRCGSRKYQWRPDKRKQGRRFKKLEGPRRAPLKQRYKKHVSFTKQLKEGPWGRTQVEEGPHEIAPVQEPELYDSGSSSCEGADETVDDIDAQAFEGMSSGPTDSEEMENNKNILDKLKKKVLNVAKGDREEEETLLDTMKHRVTKALPETLRPEPAKPRELTLLEKLSGKTEPELKPAKSVVDKVKELVIEKEEKEHKPYEREVIDDDLSQLQKILKKEEEEQPKDTVHVLANKERTPKILRFLGKFMRTDSQATKSMGGIRYDPTRADMALMSFPSPAARDRAKRRYSVGQQGAPTHATNAGIGSTNKTKNNSILASSIAFAEINSKFKNWNKNANARLKLGALGKLLRRSAKICPVCFSLTCPYYGEPGRLLLEAQLSASRYKYIHNSKADAFLTRRPVLSDYLLLESFRQGLA